MTKELEALLTELYVLIDDQVVEPRQGRGRRPELSDSELLCLAVAQMLLGFHSERRWVRHAQGNADLRKMPIAAALREPAPATIRTRTLGRSGRALGPLGGQAE